MKQCDMTSKLFALLRNAAFSSLKISEFKVETVLTSIKVLLFKAFSCIISRFLHQEIKLFKGNRRNEKINYITNGFFACKQNIWVDVLLKSEKFTRMD